MGLPLLPKSLNDNGAARWCHKPGTTAVTNKHYSGNFITNPSTADRAGVVGGYTYNYNEIVDNYYSSTGQRSVVVT